ncbi:nucleotidyl transferase AbiEii/AbiGii toxin family protein [bacterium]|nr:nucleotidyl transferase AbiEii/AbiGii toxin family protein [candidate division CSSED10-310 bacterium]MBN2641508.1 nucleotidyl transferase AbiEii/AbiGii toxin family protein [Victivallales bacterium]
MYSIAKASETDRIALFRNTAEKMNLHEAIIEKDFWVCLTLDYLFRTSKWNNVLVFKGGTSLSKAFRLIRRFSEDIDLILDWRVLGYSINEPWEKRTNSKQDLFNKEANLRAEAFLRQDLLPDIQQELSILLGIDTDMFIDEIDPQTINFKYPHIFEDDSILQTIRLEIGALAAWTPARKEVITPYAAEFYSQVFVQPSTEVLTVSPERTFWEKATILHHEANRPESSQMPARYSRHFYDLYCMMQSSVKDSSLQNVDLLQKVVEFKKQFYPRGWAQYDNAKIETLKLVPPEYRRAVLQSDYDVMRGMIFGNAPSFDELMQQIATLEAEINSLNK